MGNKWLLPVSLGVGILVGRNWGKIQKYVGPYSKILEMKVAEAFSVATKFVVEQKEHVEDMVAAAKIKKTAPAVAVAGVAKKRSRKKAVAKAVA